MAIRCQTLISPRRAAAAIGLCTALIFTLGCQETKIITDKSPLGADVVRLGDTVVAAVEGTNIYLSDVEHSALSKGIINQGEPLTPDMPAFQKELDELIDQRLLALEALRQSLDQNDETRRRLSAARERILSNVVVENLLAQKVNAETVRRMYDEQAALRTGGLQVKARHILVATEAEAKTIAGLLENGGDFAALAREYSLDRSTRDLGGDFGYFGKYALDAGLSEIAFSLKNGEVSDPFKTADGWHLIKTEARRQPPQPAFEDIKDDITAYMTYDEIDKMLKRMRASSDIQLKLGAASPVAPTLKPDSTQD